MRPAALLPALIASLALAGCVGRGTARESGAIVHARVALTGDGQRIADAGIADSRASFVGTTGGRRGTRDGAARDGAQPGPIAGILDPVSVAPFDGRSATPIRPSVGLVSGSAARCPAEMALVGGRVCVDRWEASLVVLDRAGSNKGVERALSPFEVVDDVVGYRAVSRPRVVPQGYISGLQAERACHASGKRLCTITEWERGCRGAANLRYPYGDERVEGVCNDDPRAEHPVVEAAKRMRIPQDQTWSTGMQLSLINQLPDSLLATGEKSGCVSSDGLFDMVGNLHEWVADADGTFRGGFYMDTSQNGEGCSYRTSAHDFAYHDYSTGFRCCGDPDSIE